MNVFKCMNFKVHGKHCAFAQMTLDREGKLDEMSARCGLKGSPRDDYRLVPEHDSSTGEVIYQRGFSSDPLPIGPNIIWETLSHHDTGLTYSRRRIPEDQDSHPGYQILEVNEPTSDSIGEKTVVTPYGSGAGLAFSTTGWREQRTPGLETLEKCFPGVYGTYNKAAGLVMPKCIQDHRGVIPHWNDYITLPPPAVKVQPSFILVDSTNEQIVEHCIKWFGRTRLTVVISEIMIDIKAGGFYPLYKVLINNGVHFKLVQNFLSDTNVRSKARKEANLQKYYVYYMYLKKLPKEISLVYRANLLNWLLNDPNLETMDVNKPDQVLKDGVSVFSPGKRYWWLLAIIKDAMLEVKNKRIKILNNDKLPAWLGPMLDKYLEKPKPLVEETPKAAPTIKLIDIVGEHELYNKDPQRWERKARVFTNIAKAGMRWSLPEIRAAWFNFTEAFNCKQPNRFWNWVMELKMSSEQDARLLMMTDIEIAPERAFAHHLLEAMKSESSFEVEVPHPYGRWMTSYPKGAQLYKEGSTTPTDPRDFFYTEYQRVRRDKLASAMFNRARFQLMQTSPSAAKMLIEDYIDEANEDVMLGDAVDREDVGAFRSGKINVVNIDGADVVMSQSSDPDSNFDSNPDDSETDEILDIDSAAEPSYEEPKKPKGAE